MKVTLINYTQDALETLIFTKSTRLKMSATGLETIKAWPQEKKMAELEYMLNTIKSSWEFADYVFLIEGVTRAFTHQLVRHRIGTSFAQQAQRVVDMSEFEFVETGSILEDKNLSIIYADGMDGIKDTYKKLAAAGARTQDARGILPTNIQTGIVFKANLRTLNGMAGERLCVKAQGEFQDVMRQIRDEVIAVHPWTERMLRVHCASNGTCCFPSYMDCPIKGGIFNPETGLRYDEAVHTFFDQEDGTTVDVHQKPLTKNEIHALWEVTRAEAQPHAPKD
jgi:flavin-dependent thymidylate synthase